MFKNRSLVDRAWGEEGPRLGHPTVATLQNAADAGNYWKAEMDDTCVEGWSSG